MKKTIRDSVFDSTGATGPLCTAHEDHIEVASIRVDRNGARGLTIEEQVAQLRDRLKRAEQSSESLEASVRDMMRANTKLEQKIKAMRKRARSKR